MTGDEGLVGDQLQEDIATEAEIQRDNQLKATHAVVSQLRRLGFLLTVDATAIIAAILFGPH